MQLNTGTTPGEIIFNYPDLNVGNFRSNGGSASVGMKASGAQGGNRILISQNNPASPYVSSGKAVRFVYSPGAVGGVSGTLASPANAARDQALLMALQADEGTLTPTHRKKGRRR